LFTFSLSHIELQETPESLFFPSSSCADTETVQRISAIAG